MCSNSNQKVSTFIPRVYTYINGRGKKPRAQQLRLVFAALKLYDRIFSQTHLGYLLTLFIALFFLAIDRVGDTELDDEVTDCALVEHQFKKGYIRLREYLERKRGCGRRGK